MGGVFVDDLVVPEIFDNLPKFWGGGKKKNYD
jgi:hypothetical protein